MKEEEMLLRLHDTLQKYKAEKKPLYRVIDWLNIDCMLA